MTEPGATDADGYGPIEFQSNFGVSRETIDRIDTVLACLRNWNATHNLVGRLELTRLWRRHVADSYQLWALRQGDNGAWVDLGSGSGFPGLILACAGAGTDCSFSLVESNHKKASFLRYAARSAGLNVVVHAERIENVPRETYKYVTSRALAPFRQLLDYGAKFLGDGGSCLFLKGRDASIEVEDARSDWAFDLEVRPSQTGSDGQILIVRNLIRRTI